MTSHVSFICAILGIGFAFTSSLAGIRTIVDGVFASRHVMTLPGSDPTQLTAVIGETIIAFVSRGFIAIIPALLIYLALVPFRQREQWFYSCARLTSYCLLILFPFGTIIAAIAPRGVFSNSPLKDSNFDIGGVRKAYAKAGEVFALLKAGKNLKLATPDAPHDSPEAERKAAYEWLDALLR
jgi:hypothetical protein